MAGIESTLPTNREIREKLTRMDMTLCKSIAAEHESLKHFNLICESSSWMALWDTALDHGERGTSQSLEASTNQSSGIEDVVCNMLKT